MEEPRLMKFRATNKDDGKLYYSEQIGMANFWMQVSQGIMINVQQYIGIITCGEYTYDGDLYDGDVVNACWRDEYGGEQLTNFVIYYYDQSCGFSPFANSSFDNRCYEYINLVGNIVENPELKPKEIDES